MSLFINDSKANADTVIYLVNYKSHASHTYTLF